MVIAHKAWTRIFAEKKQKLLRMKTLIPAADIPMDAVSPNSLTYNRRCGVIASLEIDRVSWFVDIPMKCKHKSLGWNFSR
jgi:hypothetical protein